MSHIVTNLLSAFLVPPLNVLLLGAVCLMIFKHNPKLGKWLTGTLLAVLWIISLPAVGNRLMALLEKDAHTPVEQMLDAQAIVVLGAGIYHNAPEYGGDTINGATMERLRLGAILQHRTGLPILVSGGAPAGGEFSEAELMKKTFEHELSTPVKWMETTSDNTRQGAVNSRKLLSSLGIQTIVLVTHSWHMNRARKVFERAGFRVIPAGTVFHTFERISLLSFVPSMLGLYSSTTFIRETAGQLWYRFTPLK